VRQTLTALYQIARSKRIVSGTSSKLPPKHNISGTLLKRLHQSAANLGMWGSESGRLLFSKVEENNLKEFVNAFKSLLPCC
jgi:hypothetical protein